MAPPSDPYRTLGLSRDASREEVRRAYRRLAKANHPDAAGPTALPRFLAIQAAYETIIHGGPGRGPSAGTSPGQGRASAADPARANATHRAYAGRSRRSRAGGGGARPKPPGQPEGAGPSPGTDSSAGTGTGAPTGRRGRGKATLGSTSYDGADAGPFEPDWGGASWYGTTSGTYWTINPREYADPRKHGPEYQARARRATRSEGGPAEAPAAAGTEDVGEPGRGEDRVHATSTWWAGSAEEMTAARDGAGVAGATDEPPPRHPPGPAPEPVRSERTGQPRTGQPRSAGPRPAGPRPADPRPADPPPPDLGAAARQLVRALTDERTARGRWRLAQALVGWLPIAFAVGWAVGELTGCSRSAASCDGTDPWLAPIAAVLVLAPLLLVPRLASLAAAGAIAVTIAAFPAAVMLSATADDASRPTRGMVLGIVLLAAWIVGVAVALTHRTRAGPDPAGTGRPVS